MADKPFLVVENRFQASPAFVKAWLTDVREDDRRRFFGEDAMITVLERTPQRTRYTQPNEMGLAEVEVVSDGPTNWHATMTVRKGETVTMVGRVDESVRADGAATLHQARLQMTPTSPIMRLFMPLMRGKIQRGLEAAFAKMRVEIEQAAAAGKDPRA